VWLIEGELMKIKYDASSDAAYIEFDIEKEEDLKYDHIEGEWPINVNINNIGKVMGIEVLDASKVMNVEYLKKASSTPKTRAQEYLERKKTNENS
jgi:uncharacterized protein YuzE